MDGNVNAEGVPQPIQQTAGVAPLALSDDPPPTKPLAGISLYLEDNYDQIQEEFGTLEDLEYKIEVRKKFKALPKDIRSEYKKRAKEAKEAYYNSLEVYLISHPSHEVDDKDREGLRKHREKLKRQMEQAELEEPPEQKKKKKKRKKKLRQRADDENQFANDDDDDIGEVEEIIQKTKKQGKKKYDPEEDERMKQRLTDMAKRMKDAAEADRRMNRMQKPAVEKLKLLKEAVQCLEQKLFHRYVIEKLEILDVIRDWLTLLPDGSLPQLNIRTEMYRILELFRLETFEPGDIRDYFLLSNQRTETMRARDPAKRNFRPFCKTVKHLCQHQKETGSNKTRLAALILKWCHPLTANASTSRPVVSENATKIKQRNKQLRARKRYIDSIESKRARLPQRPFFDFACNVSKVDDVNLQTSGRTEDDTRAQIQRTFRNLGKKTSKRMNPNLSLNGRFQFH